MKFKQKEKQKINPEAYVKTRSYKVKRHSISNNRAITPQAKAFSRIPQDHSSLSYLVSVPESY